MGEWRLEAAVPALKGDDGHTSGAFEDAIDRLKAEERYRIFANLERDASRFPMAMWRPAGEEHKPREVTVWCSNDYLGMGGHPDVIEASVRAARAHGAGAGGTRNISGTHHPIVQLEAELADLHGKPAALAFTSGWISNLAAISTIASLLAGLPHPLRRAEPQFDDRGRAPLRLREEGVAPQRRRPSRRAARG